MDAKLWQQPDRTKTGMRPRRERERHLTILLQFRRGVGGPWAHLRFDSDCPGRLGGGSGAGG